MISTLGCFGELNIGFHNHVAVASWCWHVNLYVMRDEKENEWLSDDLDTWTLSYWGDMYLDIDMLAEVS